MVNRDKGSRHVKYRENWKTHKSPTYEQALFPENICKYNLSVCPPKLSLGTQPAQSAM